MTMRRLTFICALCLVATLALAQRITRRYDNVSMSKALMEFNDLQREYVVNFIYDELARPIQERAVAAVPLLGDEAHSSFDAWTEKEDKTEY